MLFTTGACGEPDWEAVLSLTAPRMQDYADAHGYEFKQLWYDDLKPEWLTLFHDPEPFLGGAINQEVRAPFLRWKSDPHFLAPCWLRYAYILQLLDEGYDVIAYLDADVAVLDKSEDFLSLIPSTRWLATPISGPSTDNAGPGGAMMVTRNTDMSRLFWRLVWQGQLWKSHPEWTDGVDFMAMLGYTITAPVHKILTTAYDPFFCEIRNDWFTWYPGKARMIHAAGEGGSGNTAWKIGVLHQIIAEYEGGWGRHE